MTTINMPGLETHRIRPADIVTITAPDGRILLRIGADGEVDGALEDAGEAARVFVERVRELAVGMGLRLTPPVEAATRR